MIFGKQKHRWEDVDKVLKWVDVSSTVVEGRRYTKQVWAQKQVSMPTGQTRWFYTNSTRVMESV